jgi:aquaporin-3
MPESKTPSVSKVETFFIKANKLVESKVKAENDMVRRCLAEMFGTFIFLSFGLGSVAQFVFSGKTDFFAVNFSFGAGLCIAIIACGRASGGHFNPAVSFSFLIQGKLSPLGFMLYMFSQLIGSIWASVFIYFTYLNALKRHETTFYSIENAGIWGTYPNDLGVSDFEFYFSMLFDQFFATSLFIIAILAITDSKNTPMAHNHVAMLVGGSLTAIGSAFGFNCGFAVNPIRDFGPRLFTLAIFGSKTFKTGGYFFFIPIVGPMIGSVFGTFLYKFLVQFQMPTKDDEDEDF